MNEKIKILRGGINEKNERRHGDHFHEDGADVATFASMWAPGALPVTSPGHHMITLELGLGRVLWGALEYWARNLDLDLKAVDLHRGFW